MIWDTIVVGGGSAGCVVAGRLSQDEGRRVLLLEAGGEATDAILTGMRPFTPEADWGLQDVTGQPLARGRCLGGSGAVNFGMWSRGDTADYEWGHDDWTSATFTPSMARLDEAIPVDRTWPLDPASERFFKLAQQAGLQANEQLGWPEQRGYGPMPRNLVNGRRITPAQTHLCSRPNLEVRVGAVVERVVAGGVVVDNEPVHGTDIVLCAGTYGSPRLLLASGIGRGLPVGEGLMEHPGTFSVLAEPAGPPNEIFSPLAVIDSAHIILFSAASFGMPDASALMVFLMDPVSRGVVTLDRIERRLLRDDDDLDRMWAIYEWANKLVGGVEVRLAPASPDALLAGAQGYNHPSGTCAFGAVVDDRLRVKGEESVFVCDASVLPKLAMAGTNQPTMIVAERFAELYRDEA